MWTVRVQATPEPMTDLFYGQFGHSPTNHGARLAQQVGPTYCTRLLLWLWKSNISDTAQGISFHFSNIRSWGPFVKGKLNTPCGHRGGLWVFSVVWVSSIFWHGRFEVLIQSRNTFAKHTHIHKCILERTVSIHTHLMHTSRPSPHTHMHTHSSSFMHTQRSCLCTEFLPSSRGRR